MSDSSGTVPFTVLVTCGSEPYLSGNTAICRHSVQPGIGVGTRGVGCCSCEQSVVLGKDSMLT